MTAADWSEPITFRIEGGDVLLDGEWPKVTSIDSHFLYAVQPMGMTVDGDRLTISVSNGSAVYRMGEGETDVSGNYDVIPLTLIEATP